MEFESILLTYENQDRVVYQSMAEFLRLLGVFVCERVKTQKEEWEDVTKDKAEYSFEYKIRGGTKQNNHGWLEIGLATTFGISYLGKWYGQLFTEVYEKNDLLRASMTLQYYKIENEVVREAGEHFQNAVEEIAKLIEKNPEYQNNPHILYAQLFCKQKANLAYYLGEQPIAYYLDDLTEEGLRLISAFPKFANAWALLGLIYEISEKHVDATIDAFQRVIEIVGSKPYISSICYWLGKRCEERNSLRELRNVAYQKAYDLRPKYRNIYKVAQKYYEQNDWEKALFYFKQCIESLKDKGQYLDPLEQEYYFKVKVHISYIYLQLKDNYNAIVNASDVVEFRRNIAAGNPQYIQFYNDLFGKSASAYIEITLNRMQLRQVWRYLAIAYQESGMKEQADFYWDCFSEEL